MTSSWKEKPCAQTVIYPDPDALSAVTDELSQRDGLISIAAIEALKQQLTGVQANQAFLLQAGDCAETFFNPDDQGLAMTVQLLASLSTQLAQAMGKPVLRIGRIAGQYAKPRSHLMEQRAQQCLPSYRGELINGIDFTPQSRTPDPQRLLQAYDSAQAALACIQQQTSVHQPFFTSHEALHLPYERALSRTIHDRHYNLGTHFPWVGARTAALHGAHIAYLRGIDNPVAVKIAPETTPQMLVDLVRYLNPSQVPGRLTLIYRLGLEHIKTKLPALLAAVKTANLHALWCCDPMHGNTHRDGQGHKQRYLDEIQQECLQALRIHHMLDQPLHGLHLELTGEDVYECAETKSNRLMATQSPQTPTLLDPRLNAKQARVLLTRISHKLANAEEHHGQEDRGGTEVSD